MEGKRINSGESGRWVPPSADRRRGSSRFRSPSSGFASSGNGLHSRRYGYDPGHTGNPHGECRCALSPFRVAEIAGGHAPGHVLRLPEVAQGKSLLGTATQLCHAFWHTEETPEAEGFLARALPPGLSGPDGGLAGSTILCLRRGVDRCAGKGVVVIAHLTDATGSPCYVARFTNCPDNEHAEQFLCSDRQLIDTLPTIEKGGLLRIYINKTPCHHSSDHMRAQQSCTLDLLKFHDQHLAPREIKMEIVVSYTYRSHWELENLDARQRERYGPAIQAAREGLKLLGSSRRGLVSVRAFRPHDWQQIIQLCDTDVQDEYQKAAYILNRIISESDIVRATAGSENLTITARSVAQRNAMDAFIQSGIDRWVSASLSDAAQSGLPVLQASTSASSMPGATI